jgi:hypothetical protein
MTIQNKTLYFSRVKESSSFVQLTTQKDDRVVEKFHLKLIENLRKKTSFHH